MSKSANKKANRATFLAEALQAKSGLRQQERIKAYAPPPRKPGFIVKPTNPGWIAALERKTRQYYDRLNRGKLSNSLDWELDGEYFDRQATECRLWMIDTILQKGEVEIEKFWRDVACDTGISRRDFDESVRIVDRYCRVGGAGLWSMGGFLPTDADYDRSFV